MDRIEGVPRINKTKNQKEEFYNRIKMKDGYNNNNFSNERKFEKNEKKEEKQENNYNNEKTKNVDINKQYDKSNANSRYLKEKIISTWSNDERE